jgi:hypothetical protein
MPLFTTCTINVAGVSYAAGDELPEGVDPGCVESMRRLGQAIEAERPPVIVPPAGTAAADGGADVGRMNKDQLLKLAAERGLQLAGNETKAQLLALLSRPAQ